MRKLIFVFVASLFMMACNGNKVENVVDNSDSTEVVDTLVDTVNVDTIAQMSE